MIRIAQASSSEDFTKYGKAPNQRRTGVTRTKPEGNLDGELNIVAWYGGWEKVYRPIDGGVAERIANFMYEAVSNGSYIGYSWDGGTQLYDALIAKKSTNPKDIDTYVNTDCAKLVGDAIWFSGIKSNALHNLVTWKMDSVLTATNAFNVLSGKEICELGKGIRRGDILFKEGHCAVALDTDDSGVRVNLNNDGLFFKDAGGSTIGKYPNNINLNELFAFERYNFYNVNIPLGTIGTRAAQLSKAITKSGYKPLVARLCYVSDSSLANVVPFFGNGDDKTLHVNFYRASKSACKVDVGVMVVYVRSEVVK